jgi:outer membrane protein assembly factor BamB
LLSLDSLTGAVRWQYDVATSGTNLQSSPSIGSDGVVYVGTDVGGVVAVWDGSVRLQTDPACSKACNNDAAIGWSHVGGDASHRGAADYIAPRSLTTVTQRWKTLNAGRTAYYSSPLLFPANGTVIVSSTENRTYALDARTGAVRWSFELGGPSYASPALYTPHDTDDSGTTLLFVVADNRGLYCLDASAGTQIWYSSKDWTTFKASPAADTYGNVFFGDMHGCLTAVGRTGNYLWSTCNLNGADGESFQSAPTISGQDVFFNVSVCVFCVCACPCAVCV